MENTEISKKEVVIAAGKVIAGGGIIAVVDQLQTGEPITAGRMLATFGIGALVALVSLFNKKPNLRVPKTGKAKKVKNS